MSSIPSSMRAVVVKKTGGPEVLDYEKSYPVPSLKANEVLVKTTFAGINYIDTYFRTGQYPSSKPEILGREAVGTVAALGDSVSSNLGFEVGDRVAWTNATGSYAEYAPIAAEKVVKIPDSIKDEDVAASYLMGITALSLMTESYEVKSGDTILIHAAAGGTGRLMVQVAKAKGARVIGTAGGPEKCKLVKENGADEVIDYKHYSKKEEWVQKVLDLTHDKAGVEAVFDGVGKNTFDGSLDVVKRKGSVVIFGAASGPPPDIPLRRLTAKNSKLMRPTMTNYVVTRDEVEHYTKQLFEYLEQGKMKIEIFKIYPLEDVQTAHRDLEGRKTTGKLLLKI